MVDVETAQVSVRGRAKFIWRSTGRAWQESQKDITHAVSITRTELRGAFRYFLFSLLLGEDSRFD